MNSIITNIIWLLSSAIAAVECAAAPATTPGGTTSPMEKHYVVIWNDLGGDEILSSHCQSKEQDLGEVKTAPGKTLKWEIDHPPSTVHYCDMSYANYKGHFDVFVEDRDLDLCDGECRWYARPDGLFIHYNNGEITKRMYTWNNV